MGCSRKADYKLAGAIHVLGPEVAFGILRVGSWTPQWRRRPNRRRDHLAVVQEFHDALLRPERVDDEGIVAEQVPKELGS